MTKLLLILMVVSVWSGCKDSEGPMGPTGQEEGGDSPTEQEELEQIDEGWAKTFGDGYGMSVQQTVDGGFIVTGPEGEYNLFLLKTNELGYTDDLEDE